MRCFCCDKILTNTEACRRFKKSKQFTDMCTKCLDTIDTPTIDPDCEEEQLEKNDED